MVVVVVVNVGAFDVMVPLLRAAVIRAVSVRVISLTVIVRNAVTVEESMGSTTIPMLRIEEQ